MKRIVIMLLLTVAMINVNAQDRYFTRAGKVSFYSDAPMEKIEAHNSQGTSVFDAKSGQFEFAVLMKAFEFEKALMQEHFNENYVESDKFPKATFKGNIADISKVDLSKDGTYPVKVRGQMTLHGVTKDVATDGTIEVKEGKIKGNSTFNIAVADYNIEIPALVREKVAKEVKIVVDAVYSKMASK